MRAVLDEDVLRRMAAALRHRGPDGEGVARFALGPDPDAWQVGLAHRRLAVFDPTPAGAQPMTSRSGRTTLVLNGEIYNHPELRRELTGFPWRTGTDTEVLLELLEARGSAVLPRLRGMFAFAAFDARERRLLLARDAAGVKPLYVRSAPDALIFASELRAILAGPAFERRLDPDALDAYLDLGFVAGARSLLAGVVRLPPGTLLEWRAGRARVERWWRLPPPAPPRAAPGWREALYAALEEAVRLQLRADVPVGTFLSGGLDSTLVTALAARQRPDLRTFSVRFTDGGILDESRFARAAALALGTRHSELEMTGADAAELAPGLLAGLDEPLGDGSLLPVHALSRAARAELTVALSGDGADELFAGYRRYRGDRWLARWERIPGPLRRGVLAPLLSRLGESRDGRAGELARRARKVIASEGLAPEARQLALARLCSETDKARLLPPARRGRPGASLALLRDVRARAGGGDELETRLRSDFLLGLPDDMLTKVDRASMAVGLEVRVPFLDPRVVEQAMALPAAARLGRGQGKQPLRDVFAGLVPPSVRRRRKAGFDAPLTRWLRGPLRPLARDVLAAEALERDGLFEPKVVAGWLDDHEAGRADHAWRIWGLLVVCDWMRRHRVV